MHTGSLTQVNFIYIFCRFISKVHFPEYKRRALKICMYFRVNRVIVIYIYIYAYMLFLFPNLKVAYRFKK